MQFRLLSVSSCCRWLHATRVAPHFSLPLSLSLTHTHTPSSSFSAVLIGINRRKHEGHDLGTRDDVIHSDVQYCVQIIALV